MHSYELSRRPSMVRRPDDPRDFIFVSLPEPSEQPLSPHSPVHDRIVMRLTLQQGEVTFDYDICTN